eukprot:TRINITY_DN3086_c0_g1_i1.p1 TRINITY_DN3086_c0_g1~~TRINITY_DN3086_c0_g1_i1.p1  ORF type:complete len:123 (+),score=47.28 TRINITY_DN3086_c0_g1_i1:2-370(+)
MNLPEPLDAIKLEENEEKIEIKRDTKLKNAATITVAKEDHTVGNLVAQQLLKDKDILFAGYRVRHPLEYNIEFKIQTKPTSNPEKALKDSINHLISNLSTLKKQFEQEKKRFPGEDRNRWNY